MHTSREIPEINESAAKTATLLCERMLPLVLNFALWLSAAHPETQRIRRPWRLKVGDPLTLPIALPVCKQSIISHHSTGATKSIRGRELGGGDVIELCRTAVTRRVHRASLPLLIDAQPARAYNQESKDNSEDGHIDGGNGDE
jgi:hypothetical protein